MTENDPGQTAWRAGERPWYVGPQTGPQTSGVVSGAERSLIISIGDGVQGPTGSIAGQGSTDDIFEVVKSCSNADLHIMRLYHGASIIVRATERDGETVECIMQRTSRLFAAGYGPARDGLITNHKPFNQFAIRPN